MGLSVPDNKFGKAEEFIRKYPFIDVLSHQEGERTILKLLLDEYPNNNLQDTPNISYYRKREESIEIILTLPRLKDFDKVPSPYLTGIFDELIRQNPE